MLEINSKINLTDEEFKLLSDTINEFCGLYYDISKKYLIENRLSPRLKKLNFTNFKEYYYYLKYDPKRLQEFDNITDLLTTNETYFFRETGQIKILIDEIIPELIRNNKKYIKIWSSAASSGEEAYTIVMELFENNLIRQDITYEIIGTDISLKILDAAKRAAYSQFSFRAANSSYLEKYFIKTGNSSEYQLIDKIKTKVRFERFNLLDDTGYMKYKNADVIFCRNVLIYFEDSIKKRVVNNMHKILNPNGILFLGHSESLFKFSVAFELKQFKNGLGYIKK
ncbi:MAG TPA: protein-glutamate O-methyltransferase CheR [bacterium]|nr:protein-glutamate O-methyltransferase CheR [bacterium]HPN30642.1 protein-glutamate O-methyltransferase CheR [bacterium]